MAYEHTLASDDPVRVRITVPGDVVTLELTLDGSLDVIEVTRSGGRAARD